MTVWILSDKEQNEIARIYSLKFHNQYQLADKYGVSVGTISKVLREKGVTGKAPVITVEQANLLQVADKYKLNAAKLEEAINLPALTFPNVQRYLEGLEQDRLLTLFSRTSIGSWLLSLQPKEEQHVESN